MYAKTFEHFIIRIIKQLQMLGVCARASVHFCVRVCVFVAYATNA